MLHPTDVIHHRTRSRMGRVRKQRNPCLDDIIVLAVFSAHTFVQAVNFPFPLLFLLLCSDQLRDAATIPGIDSEFRDILCSSFTPSQRAGTETRAQPMADVPLCTAGNVVRRFLQLNTFPISL